MRFSSTALTAFAATSYAITTTCSAFQPSFGLSKSRSAIGHVTSTPVSSKSALFAAADDDDDDEDFDDDEDTTPLSKGVDSVSWLPTVAGATSVVEMSSADSGDGEADVLPLFPLGGIVYTPNSEHVLNIFEPRYRQMYTDILMNGTKRFVVAMSHPNEKGRFAQMGVLFELEDLKEVSEQTQDQIKYICNHKVTGRVKLHRILNPEAWEARDTYLQVEGTIIDDTTLDAEAQAGLAAADEAETKLRTTFKDLVEIQHELEEDVRFTKASVLTLAVSDGPGETGLWQTIRLWQAYADQRLMARQNELQKDFQEKLQEFLKKEKGLEELPSAVGFQDLSPALQQEVQDLQKRMAVELEPLMLESTLTMQKILEQQSHPDRCDLLRYFCDAERMRLNTKKTLQGMFSGTSTTIETTSSKDDDATPSFPPEELVEPAADDATSLFDEPDAFQ